VSLATGTVLLGSKKANDLVKLTLSFGALPFPGNSPSYSATAQLFAPDGTPGPITTANPSAC
jgi:hypothetical protein